MASRLQNFIRLQNIFHLKIFNRNQIILQKPSVVFFGTNAKPRNFLKTASVIGGLGLAGGCYGYLAAPDRKSRIEAVPVNEKLDYRIEYEVPKIKASREMLGPATNIDLDFTLYQYQNCPFCCKVRAFLDFYGIPYKVIEVNPVMRQQLKFSEYKKVPILIAEDKKTSVKYQLNDSSLIISILGTFLLNSHDKLDNVLKNFVPIAYQNDVGKKVKEVLNMYSVMYGEKKLKGKTDESLKNERQWRKWADSHLVHILSPNIYRTYDEALQAFNYFSEVGEWEKNFAAWERTFVIYVGATAMYLIGKRLKKRHSLKDDVRQSLYDACNQWTKAIGPKQKFMGGDIPDLSDLAVYGLLNSIEGCIAFKDVLGKTNIGPWYYRMKEAASNHVGYKLIN